MKNKKELYCVHDKKSNTYDGFVLYNNAAEAVRSFQMACEKNEVFLKWPEDFQLVKVLEIPYDENGFQNEVTVMAEAKDFVVKKTEEKKIKHQQAQKTPETNSGVFLIEQEISKWQIMTRGY